MGDRPTVPVGVLVENAQRSETHLTGETTLDYPLHGEQSRCIKSRGRCGGGQLRPCSLRPEEMPVSFA